MSNKLGTNADYEKEFGNMPAGRFVRKLVKLDRQDANESLFKDNIDNARKMIKIINYIKTNTEII